MRYAVLCAALTLGAVFVVSAVSKVSSRAAYGSFVAATGRLLPARSLPRRPFALAVVAGEFAVAPLLLLVPTVGLALAAALSLAFAAGILSAVRRGVRAPCRCFGASAAPLRRLHAVRGGALAVVALGALGQLAGAGAVRLTAAGLLAGLHPAGAALAAVGSAALVLLTIYFDDIAELFKPTPTLAGRAGPAERI